MRDERGQFLYKVRTGAFVNPALARTEARRLADRLDIEVIVSDLTGSAGPSDCRACHPPPAPRRRRPKLTPMLAQYLEIKAAHPGSLLLFRMGDFYETFFEDAEVLARTAGVTLTSRDAKSDHPVPLAGVPYHALDTYLTRLLNAGLTVAICEQVEDPALAKGLVKREVVEIISPGTATSPELVDGAFAVTTAWPGCRRAGRPDGWALLDASTGEFRCGQEDGHPGEPLPAPPGPRGDRARGHRRVRRWSALARGPARRW